MCSPSAPATPTSTSQTTIPEYAQPTAERLVGRAEALSEAEYTPYGGQRLADQTQQQKDITAKVLAQEAPGQFQTGTALSTAGGLRSLKREIQPLGLVPSICLLLLIQAKSVP
jgi:hypothetical protein